MKSEKAKLLLRQALTRNEHLCTGMVTFEQASNAAEIAELEAAERMREELTRWHDPKKELPEDKRVVLTRKAKDGEWGYMVAGYASEIGKWVTTYHKVYMDVGLSPLDVEDYQPNGWREIHE